MTLRPLNNNPTRFFLGKNKLMQKALGTRPEDEIRDNLRHLTKVCACLHVYINDRKGGIARMGWVEWGHLCAFDQSIRPYVILHQCRYRRSG